MKLLIASWRRFLHQYRSLYAAPEGRLGELFEENFRQIHQRAGRIMLWLLGVQYPAVVLVALCLTPWTWSGAERSVHPHVWLAAGLGGLITAFPLYLLRSAPGSPLTRHVLAAAQMLMGAVLIHVGGGRIEMHFHIFGSLAFLSFYRDLGMLSTATLVVVLDHLLRGLFLPASVYGSPTASLWRFAEHAAWVLFENVFLAVACIQSRIQIKAMIGQQAELEKLNESIEAAVVERTRELAQARDEAMESTRLKSQFLANVSHELRTPMNGILGMTGFLLDSDLSSDQRECAETVRRSAESLLGVINDILDFSRIEAGKLTLESVAFRPESEVADTVRLLASLAEEKGLEFVCDLPPDLPFLVNGDAGRLRQVLLNLLGNAIKFTARGVVSLCLRTRPLTNGQVSLQFTITDTGVGIAPEAQRLLFQPFVQADGSATRSHQGAGLGLAISKQLVELMGGQISLKSTLGQGTQVHFQIPVDVLRHVSSTEPPSLKGLRALVVDDHPANREILMRMLRSAGMEAEEAAGAGEAIDRWRQAQAASPPYDIALLDFQMPGMDGMTLAAELARTAPLKALLLTSLGQRQLCESMTENGILGCMVKPVRRDHLLLKIALVCGRWTAPVIASPPNSTQFLHPNTEALRVLVVEDNAVNRKVILRMLSRLGHQHALAKDGIEALDLLSAQVFDLILMDCQMPGMDGFDTTRIIRQMDGPLATIPVIAVTANAMQGDREKCLAAGMNGYLSKPLHLAALKTALENHSPAAVTPS